MKKITRKITISTLYSVLLFSLLTGCSKKQDTLQEDIKGNQSNAPDIDQSNNQAAGQDISTFHTDNSTAESIWENGYDLPLDEIENTSMELDCINIGTSIIQELQAAGIKIISREEAAENSFDDTTADIDRIMINVINDQGYPVRIQKVYAELKNYEALEDFILKAKDNQPGEVILYQIHSGTGFSREKFSYDGQDMYHLQANVTLSETGAPQITSLSYCRIKEWNYTEKGWFCYELCAPQPPEALEVIDSNVMIRVLPMESQYKEIAEKYLLPIGYQGNNLFCSEWNETQLAALDYNGLYEYLYAMKYQTMLDEEASSDGIDEDEFTELMLEYLPVTKEELKQYAAYDREKKVFIWNRLGCFNYAPNAFGGSIPEITSIVEHEDGTADITVDAVCETARDDQVFTHVVTVRLLENGQIMFLGNKILERGLNSIPDYQYRITNE